MLDGRFGFKALESFLVIVNLAVCGLVCVYAAMAYMNLGFSPDIGLLCIGIIASIYLFNRVTDITEDVANNARRLIFFVHRRELMTCSVILALFTIGYCIWRFRVSTYEVYLLIVGMMYSFPLIPLSGMRSFKEVKFIRLKDIPFMKNILVALMWSVSIYLIPIIHADKVPKVTFMVYLLIIAQIVATLSNTIDSDVLDEVGDRLCGVKSLPVMIGVRKTYMVLWSMITVWIATVWILRIMNSIRTYEAIFLTMFALWPLAVIVLRKAFRWSKGVASIAGDMQLMIYGCGILWLSHVR